MSAGSDDAAVTPIPAATPMPPGASRAFTLEVARAMFAHLRKINGRGVLRNLLRRHHLWTVLRVYAKAPSCSAANAQAIESIAAAFERHRITWQEAAQAPREPAP